VTPPKFKRYALWLSVLLALGAGFHGYDSGYFTFALARLKLQVAGESASATESPSAAPEPPRTALEFLGTGFTEGRARHAFQYILLRFADVTTDCLPIYPVTVIWRAKPDRKTGYYSTFSGETTVAFKWKQGIPDSFWGAHPYPDTGVGNFNVHHWEIATDFGGDIVDTIAGTRRTLVTGAWYAQGFRAWRAFGEGRSTVSTLTCPLWNRPPSSRPGSNPPLAMSTPQTRPWSGAALPGAGILEMTNLPRSDQRHSNI